jgi:hypothetical protein
VKEGKGIRAENIHHKIELGHRMNPSQTMIYTSKIIKAGALLADTKTLFTHWSEPHSVAENLERFRRDNLFGKTSRSRVEDILAIFRQRYLADAQLTRALIALVKGHLPAKSLDSVLYFHAAQSDWLLHDFVTEFLAARHQQGRNDLDIEDVQAVLAQWVREGKTTGQWSEGTIIRVAQGLLSTLRDFGLLQGAVKKHLTSPYVPVESFAWIAFYLRKRQPSGERLLHDPDWRLFFLAPQTVERLFLEAHQRRLLEYHAAGPVIRISFPAESLEEYARVIAQRPY